MEELVESSRRESAVLTSPLFYIKDNGLLNYFIDLQTKNDMDKQKDVIPTKWG